MISAGYVRPARSRSRHFGAHFGAPGHLWALTIDRYGDGQIGLLMSRPDALRQALVDTWRTWRRAWIEGEWR